MYIELCVNVSVVTTRTAEFTELSYTNKLLLNVKRRKMAIAFFVPPEYGPPQPQQPGQVPVVELHSNDINNNATPRAVNNPAPRRETLVSFLSSFVTELITVFGTQPRPVNNQARNESRSFRQRRPAAQQLPNIRISHEGKNQIFS